MSSVRYTARTGAVLFARNVDRLAAFYAAVLGLDVAAREDDHILLESPGFQLVVHRAKGDGAVTAGQADAPSRRATAAVKLVFFVPSISALSAVAAAHGGVVESADSEWSYQGMVVCDGIDPEGNVVQFRGGAG